MIDCFFLSKTLLLSSFDFIKYNILIDINLSSMLFKSEFRSTRIAKRIKRKIFEMSSEKYPNALIFKLLALPLMKMNHELILNRSLIQSCLRKTFSGIIESLHQLSHTNKQRGANCLCRQCCMIRSKNCSLENLCSCFNDG